MTTRTEKTSYGVTIPIDYIRKLKWKTKQKLEVTHYQDRIIIRDWNRSDFFFQLKRSQLKNKNVYL